MPALFKKINSPLKWILLAIFIKSLFFIWYTVAFSTTHWAKNDKIVAGVFVEAHDWGDYMMPIVNLVDKGFLGNETLKEKGDNGMLWAHRMPGFVPICAPLYYFFGYKGTCIVLAILQLICDAIACYLVAWIALFLFKSQIAFNITFILYALSSFVSVYTHYGSSESLCTFFIIISVYYFLKFTGENKSKYLFYCGLFITWAVFMRPAIGLMFALFPLLYFMNSSFMKELKLKKIISHLFIFGIVFFIVEAIWVYRNYNVLHRFVPLEISQENFGSPQYRAWIKFTSQMACEQFNKDDKNALRWFNPNFRNEPEVLNGNPFNEKNFTADFNFDSLKVLRNLNLLSTDTALAEEKRKQCGDLVLLKIDSYSKSLRINHVFRYYFINKLILLQKFLFVKQTYALPFIENSLYQKSVRGANWLLNSFTIALGLLGMLLSIIQKNKLAFSISLLALVHIFVHALILGFIEHRYLVSVFPLLVIFSSLPLSLLFSKFFRAPKLNAA